MAKKKNEELLNIEEVIVEEEKKQEIADVVIEQVENKVVEENVKIKLKMSHRCFIGDTWYNFEANKVYIVPKSVKDILMKNDLLMPL